MGSFCDHPRLLELTTRVLCDTQPTYSDVAYLFGQTSDNENSVLLAALRLKKFAKTKLIVICDGETNHGYPGFNVWRQKLLNAGMETSEIRPSTIPPNIGTNTLTEALALIEAAKNQQWQKISIVAAPFHQLRAFVTVVSVLIPMGDPSIKIFNHVGEALPWQIQARHSQGTTVGRRHELIKGEMDRLNRYHKQGDLASPEEVLGYLDRRDS